MKNLTQYSHWANGAMLIGLAFLGLALYEPSARKGNPLQMLDLLHEAAWAQCKIEGSKRVAALLR